VGLSLGIGIPAAVGTGHLIASQLFGVNPGNPWLPAAPTALQGLAALTPARSTASIDPMRA